MAELSIVAATGNPNKLRELQVVGRRFGIRVLDPRDVMREHALPAPPDPEEHGRSYYENAKIKAEAFAAWCGEACLGDDSGLEVTALGNIPGLHSARYLGLQASYEERMKKLIELLQKRERQQEVRNRDAYYHCSLVLIRPGEPELTSSACIEGEILDDFRGSGGFGYDPIFLIRELGLTFAEIDFSITCTKGFRARAAERLFRELVGK